MEHVVFFPAHDGSPAFRRVGSLEDAVRLVEHLRNVENVSEVSVHSLSEVPLAFKPWYRVELPEGEQVAPAAPAAPPVVPAVATPEQPPAPAPDVPAVAPVAAAADVAPAVIDVPEQAEPSLVDPAREAGAASLGFFAS